MLLEVCVDSFKSLKIAKEAGANRIELCSALYLGGLTPSYGLMRQASLVKGIEVFVMIRPRSGDFLYNDEELETMRKDIELVKELSFPGIVIGFLREDGSLDLDRISRFVELSKPLEVVLHRAFDHAKEPDKDIGGLIDMGVKRILTSGQKPTAIEGIDYIKDLNRVYGKKIGIMPGSGINADNIPRIVKETGCTEIHMSGKVNMASEMKYNEDIGRLKLKERDLLIERASFDKIKEARDILDKLSEEA